MSACNYCVASICSSIESSTDIVILSKDVYKLALAFITPLAAENDCELGVESI